MTTRTCLKCGQTVERLETRIPLWVLPEEVGSGRATFCPGSDGGSRLHEVDEDEDDQ